VNLYLPLNTIAPVPGGLIVSGILARRDAAVERVELADRAVAEMTAVEPVGSVADLKLLADGTLFCRARITAPNAILKVSEGVYRGFALVISRDGLVERIALVDRPDAFQKRTGHHPAAAPLPLTFRAEVKPPMDMLGIFTAIVAADPRRRGEVAKVLLDDYDRRRAPRGNVLRKSAAPTTLPSVVDRAVRDREEHAQRIAKGIGVRPDVAERAAATVGGFELFKASRRPQIELPGITDYGRR